MADTKSKAPVFLKAILIVALLVLAGLMVFAYLLFGIDGVKDLSIDRKARKEKVYTFEEYDESFFPDRESDGPLVVKVSKTTVDLTNLKGSGVEGIYEDDEVKYSKFLEDTGCHIEDYIVYTNDGMKVTIYVDHGCEYVEISIYGADHKLIFQADQDI